MSFSEAVRAFFARYSDFRGRSSRSEYWWAMAFLFLVMLVTAIFDRAVFRQSVLTALFQLAVTIPSWCVHIRRLHDTDHTGWWLLAMPAVVVVGFVGTFAAVGIPGTKGPGTLILLLSVFLVGFSGYLMLFVWTCLRGTPGPNRFGPDPLDGRLA